MWQLLARGLAWAGQLALGWVGSDWFNERQTTKQMSPEASEKVIIQNTAKKHWVKWAVTAGALAVGYIIFNKFFEKKR
jgi:hypothetical protein